VKISSFCSFFSFMSLLDHSRSGDLIRPKKEAARNWDPARDTHRGRISGEWAFETSGVRYRRIILSLKPTKTDPTGEEQWEKSFRVDNTPGALSAGAALIDMLLNDPSPSLIAESTVPMFRHPETGSELTYAQSSVFLQELLQNAGYDTVTLKNHSLRIGGATSIANDPLGGDFVAGCAGLWTSDCKFRYFHVIRERLESATQAIGRNPGGSLARRPGAFASYRHG
jgi:hypothetical protein